jgi:hypothetical protein
MSNSKSNKREYKEYDFRYFPFELLALDIGKELKVSGYNNIHISTVIEENGQTYNYFITFKGVLFHSKSFIYYQDTNEKKADPSPIFYNYPKLHPNYEKRDNLGNVTKEKDKIGQEIEIFFEKFRTKIETLVNSLPKNLKSQICGPKLSILQSGFISKITEFPLNTFKQPDENQSPTMKLRLWTVQKKTEENNQQPINTDESNNVIVPGTNPNMKILTTIYDKRNLKTKAKIITKYESLRPFIYSSAKHNNASPGIKTLTYTMNLTSPVLHSGKEGVDIQLTLSRLIFTSLNSSSRNKELTLEDEQDSVILTEKAKKEDGVKDDNDESTIDEAVDDDSPPGSQINKRKRETEEEIDEHQNKRQKIE